MTKGTRKRHILSLFEPRFRKMAEQAGKLYVWPYLSDDFVEEFDNDRYDLLDNRYRKLLDQAPVIQEI